MCFCSVSAEDYDDFGGDSVAKVSLRGAIVQGPGRRDGESHMLVERRPAREHFSRRHKVHNVPIYRQQLKEFDSNSPSAQ